MPQGSSAWVWMSIATKSSMLGSFNWGMFVPGLISWLGKLIIRYNKLRKTAKNKAETGGRDGGGLRDRFLERCQFAESLGRHRPGRAAQDQCLHANQASDQALLQGGQGNPPDLFLRGLCQDHPLWRGSLAG